MAPVVAARADDPLGVRHAEGPAPLAPTARSTAGAVRHPWPGRSTRPLSNWPLATRSMRLSPGSGPRCWNTSESGARRLLRPRRPLAPVGPARLARSPRPWMAGLGTTVFRPPTIATMAEVPGAMLERPIDRRLRWRRSHRPTARPRPLAGRRPSRPHCPRARDHRGRLFLSLFASGELARSTPLPSAISPSRCWISSGLDRVKVIHGWCGDRPMIADACRETPLGRSVR